MQQRSKYVSHKKKRKEKSLRKYLEIIVKKFPNMGKEIATQVQEEQRIPYRIKPRTNKPGNILVKLTNFC